MKMVTVTIATPNTPHMRINGFLPLKNYKKPLETKWHRCNPVGLVTIKRAGVFRPVRTATPEAQETAAGLSNLVDKGLLLQTVDRGADQLYRFQIPLLARWLLSRSSATTKEESYHAQ